MAGEIRQVSQPDLRLKEASKLGFREAIVPANKKSKKPKRVSGEDIRISEIDHVQMLGDLFGANQSPRAVA